MAAADMIGTTTLFPLAFCPWMLSMPHGEGCPDALVPGACLLGRCTGEKVCMVGGEGCHLEKNDTGMTRSRVVEIRCMSVSGQGQQRPTQRLFLFHLDGE